MVRRIEGWIGCGLEKGWVDEMDFFGERMEWMIGGWGLENGWMDN